MDIRLRQVSARELVKALSKLGYIVYRQKGSHLHLRCPGRPPLTVPNHNPISKGTLRAIIRQSGLTLEQFSNLLLG